jgi:hypothetical protein
MMHASRVQRVTVTPSTSPIQQRNSATFNTFARNNGAKKNVSPVDAGKASKIYPSPIQDSKNVRNFPVN